MSKAFACFAVAALICTFQRHAQGTDVRTEVFRLMNFQSSTLVETESVANVRWLTQCVLLAVARGKDVSVFTENLQACTLSTVDFSVSFDPNADAVEGFFRLPDNIDVDTATDLVKAPASAFLNTNSLENVISLAHCIHLANTNNALALH